MRPTMTVIRSGAGLLAVAAAGLAILAVSASAGPTGHWTQITHTHNGARANLGLGRAKNGTLHVLWAGPARRPYTAILDTPISLAGKVGKPQTVVSGWDSVQPPAAAVALDGSIHAVISGQKVPAPTDPFSGLNEAVGPGSWHLGSAAFGSSQITVSSSADVAAGVLANGQLVTVWRSAASLLFQTGVDPATTPQPVTQSNDVGTGPALAVDGGRAVIAYRGASSGTVFFRQIVPSLGEPRAMPQAKTDGPSIAGRRSGGGVYSAYTPDGTRVWLLRFGGQPKSVPVPKGVQVLTAGLAAGPDGRLWVFYGNAQQTYVTRTSKGVSGFEPVQALKSPPGTIQYFRLEGEGSAGPLDLFADITVDGASRDGSYQTHVLPALSLAVSKKATKAGVRVTVRVTDAGDPVAGARVSGLPGGARTTDAKGSVSFAAPATNAGTFALTATKPGYVAARGRVSLR